MTSWRDFGTGTLPYMSCKQSNFFTATIESAKLPDSRARRRRPLLSILSYSEHVSPCSSQNFSECALLCKECPSTLRPPSSRPWADYRWVRPHLGKGCTLLHILIRIDVLNVCYGLLNTPYLRLIRVLLLLNRMCWICSNAVVSTVLPMLCSISSSEKGMIESSSSRKK